MIRFIKLKIIFVIELFFLRLIWKRKSFKIPDPLKYIFNILMKKLRNPIGIRAEDWYSSWPIIPIDATESTFACQEYIQALIRKDPSNISAILQIPENQDENVWQYEHLRCYLP